MTPLEIGYLVIFGGIVSIGIASAVAIAIVKRRKSKQNDMSVE